MPPVVGVAHVTDSLARGGAERVVVSLANLLDSDRFRSHVIATRHLGGYVEDLAPHVTTHNLARRSRWDIHALYRFAALLRRNNIRIVHTHSHTTAYFARIARLLSKQQWLHVMHDHLPTTENSTWLQRLDRLFLTQTDYYFAVSRQLHEYAIKRLGLPFNRCEYLRNGVDVPPYSQPIPGPRFTVVQVARVAPNKNHRMAVEVAAMVRKYVPDLQWLIVGRMDESIEETRTCLRLVDELDLGDTVLFLGEHRDVRALLGQAHVGVLTSRYEGLPIALLEYMACGLPVVATDTGACKEVVEEGGGGIVVGINDVEQFSQALVSLAHARDRLVALGCRNYDCVAERYSTKAMSNRVMAVYEMLMQQ